MERLIYQNSPVVTFASNIFINVPIIFQYENTPLISVVREQHLGYTTEIPIYNQDGVYLAKIKGTRVYPTKEGEKAGVSMRKLPTMTICEMNKKTLFEIQHQQGDSFKISAELYTPTGLFVKSTDIPEITAIDQNGESLQIGGLTMTNCTFSGLRIGLLLKKDGSIAIGCQ